MLIEVRGSRPVVDPTAWVAPNATLVGAVSLGARTSVWYSAVVRADLESITIGERTNVQDGCVLHADPGRPLVLGGGITVGHAAVLHGYTIGDDVLVGMGSIILNGAVVEPGVLIGAGCPIPENTVIPSGSLVLGSPGRVRRHLTGAERDRIRDNAEQYVRLSDLHRTGARQSPPGPGG
ncbi:MAG TPA: gamma carbonic anhydrase family protein [Micromonosporaceae bacterium]